MGLLSRIDRALARFNDRFGVFAVATDVEGPGMGPQMNTAGVRVVADEIRRESGGDEAGEQDPNRPE
jgi:hypothetical protein